jgi:hypothetical protein
VVISDNYFYRRKEWLTLVTLVRNMPGGSSSIRHNKHDTCNRKLACNTLRYEVTLRAQEESIIEKTLQTLCQEELAAF